MQAASTAPRISAVAPSREIAHLLPRPQGVELLLDGGEPSALRVQLAHRSLQGAHLCGKGLISPEAVGQAPGTAATACQWEAKAQECGQVLACVRVCLRLHSRWPAKITPNLPTSIYLPHAIRVCDISYIQSHETPSCVLVNWYELLV